MNFRRTVSQFLKNTFDYTAPVELPEHEQAHLYQAKTGSRKPDNDQLIHETILREQFKTKGQFICDMMDTKGEDRTKFMTEFCARNNLEYNPTPRPV